MSDFGINPTQLVMLVILVVIITLTMANARRKSRQGGPSPREYAREQIARLREHESVKGDMEELVVELHEAARRLNAQMDTKAARLEALIRDADDRIASLQVHSSAGSVERPPEAPEAGHINVLLDDSPPASENPTETDPVRSRILNLAREGRNPVQIAQDTGVPPGEVELIIALQESSKRPGRGS